MMNKLIKITIFLLGFNIGFVQAGIEPDSGVSFPETLQIEETNTALLAMGIRRKFFFQVYAVGLYASNELAEASQYWPINHTAYIDTKLLKNIQNSQSSFILRLVFVRDVGLDSMQSAMKDALSSRLPTAQKTNLLSRFSDSLTKEIKENYVLNFYLLPTKIGIEYPNQPIVWLDSPELSKALLATYIDERSVADDLSENLLKKLRSLYK